MEIPTSFGRQDGTRADAALWRTASSACGQVKIERGRVGNHHDPLKKRTIFSGWIIDEKPWEIKKQWHKTIGNQFWFGAQNWSSSNWWEFEELFKLLHFSRTSCFWYHNLCSPSPSWYWSIHVGFKIPWFHEYQLFFPNSMEGSSLFFPWKTGVFFASFVRFQPCFFLEMICVLRDIVDPIRARTRLLRQGWLGDYGKAVFNMWTEFVRPFPFQQSTEIQ